MHRIARKWFTVELWLFYFEVLLLFSSSSLYMNYFREGFLGFGLWEWKFLAWTFGIRCPLGEEMIGFLVVRVMDLRVHVALLLAFLGV